MGRDTSPELSETVTPDHADAQVQPPARPLADGDRFADRYDITGVLGRGGMGTVYRARDTLVGEDIALKILELASATDESIQRFRREVRLARRISHPHVARTHDLGESGGQHYLTMELVPGQSLRALLKQEHALEPGRALVVATGVCEGLAAAHAVGVVHRDLKPENVLVEPSGRVVLTDFGIARSVRVGDAEHRTVGTVGTPLYMAPEQVEGREVDARTDVYAAGLLLYEMLCGEPAFAADSAVAAAVARLTRPPPDPRDHAPVPDGLAELLLRCLSRDPEGRPSDARALLEALRNLGRGASLTPTQASTTNRAPIAPISRGAETIAVLPFRYRGPADQEYLGDAIADELIDLLSQVAKLRVLGSGATERFREQRDPRAIGRESSADYVVDGTVQSMGPRLRLTVRLLDTEKGTQLWSERLDHELEDLFELQDRVCRRVAEALRTELRTARVRGVVPPEALEAYLRARPLSRSFAAGSSEEVMDHLERCLELAPDFAPALALHALVAVRGWFLPQADTARDWGKLARDSTERAQEQAADEVETWIAVGRVAMHEARWRDAIDGLRKALELAPTSAEAQTYLGQLQLEAGRPDEGLERLQLAAELRPDMWQAQFEIARYHALQGDRAAFQASLSTLEEGRPGDSTFPLVMRVAVWWKDTAWVEKLLAEPDIEPTMASQFMRLYGAVFAGHVAPDKGLEPLRPILESSISPRFEVLVCQMAAEVNAAVGAVEPALEWVERAASSVLLDLVWLDRCPALDALRVEPRFQAARARVRARCHELWRG